MLFLTLKSFVRYCLVDVREEILQENGMLSRADQAVKVFVFVRVVCRKT